MELRVVPVSSLRQKILTVLSQKHEMQVMRHTYNKLYHNLLLLEREGIIIKPSIFFITLELTKKGLGFRLGLGFWRSKSSR
jgi:hypothetical protein